MASMNLMRTLAAGVFLLFLANQGTALNSSEMTALLTQIEGQVNLYSQEKAEFRSVRSASYRQVLHRGETVHLAAGAQVTLICSTERLLRLSGPRDWVADETACERGFPLPEGSYRNLTFFAGRILPKGGALLLEIETRYANVELGPSLLSPRNSAVMNPYPRLVWTQVPDAGEYEIELRGPVEKSIHVAAKDLKCGRGVDSWYDLDVCSWTPAGSWPALEPDKPVFLRLGSRRSAAASLCQVQEVYQLELLSVDNQRSVHESLRRIAALPLDQASRLLLTAEAYAQRKLYSDAIFSYKEILKMGEISGVRVRLGDLYLILDLPAFADREYRQVLAGTPDPVLRAAAELGLGYLAYFGRLFSEAQAHFEQARTLYSDLGMLGEAEEARAAVVHLQAYRNHALP